MRTCQAFGGRLTEDKMDDSAVRVKPDSQHSYTHTHTHTQTNIQTTR